jgi:chromosome partitioning protein
MQLFNKPRREDRLKHALSPVRELYEFIVIDCPPSLGILTVNALSASDGVLIPMSTDYYGMLGAQLMLQTIAEIREEINPLLQVLGILPTRMRPTVNAREVLARLHKELDGQVPIYKDHIPETVKFQEAAGLGITIFDHDPDSHGASAYTALAKEVAHGTA